MLPNTDSPLGDLFARLANWVSLSDFEKMLADYFNGTRSPAEIADYRAKRGAVKKLRDEVVPVLHHIKFAKAEGDIRFELNSSVPDCWLRANPHASPQGLEITVAQSREQHLLGQKLNEKGIGRGFLRLPDDAPKQAFKARLARPRVMYATDTALKVIGNGVEYCLHKKAHPKYAGHDLLIEAPFHRCSCRSKRSRMITNYYVDESGNGGDLVNAGDAFDFGQQPVFALSCIGVDEVADLEQEIARLKQRHNVRSPELKSTTVKDKPGFVADVIAYLERHRLPVFIEVVDKRFFICATMINHFVVPPVGDFDLQPDVIKMKDIMAEYLYAVMPAPVMQAYIDACMVPSVEGTRRAFETLLSWLRSCMPSDGVAAGVERFAADSYSDFEEMASSHDANVRAFLPVPDQGKRKKSFWMLPNLSSFTNIYARINLMHGQDIANVRIFHDEQPQFDHILDDGKRFAEQFYE